LLREAPASDDNRDNNPAGRLRPFNEGQMGYRVATRGFHAWPQASLLPDTHSFRRFNNNERELPRLLHRFDRYTGSGRGQWRPRVAIRWEEQFRIQQVVFEPARFARPFTTDKQAEQYGHAVIRKWVAAGRPNIAPSALL
jgi:hypothetical protein